MADSLRKAIPRGNSHTPSAGRFAVVLSKKRLDHPSALRVGALPETIIGEPLCRNRVSDFQVVTSPMHHHPHRLSRLAITGSAWLFIAGVVLGTAGCGGEASPAKPSVASSSPSSMDAKSGPVSAVKPPVSNSDSETSTPSAAPKSPTVPTSELTATSNPSPTSTTVELQELDWEQLQQLVASHKGKVVVVDVWSTACEPCLRELPRLVTLQQRHPDDVVCIAFDCDFAGIKNKPVAYYRERVLKALAEVHAEHVINGISTLDAEELFKQIKLDSIPAVYVYDRAGKLSKRFDNTTPASETDAILSALELNIDAAIEAPEIARAEEAAATLRQAILAAAFRGELA